MKTLTRRQFGLGLVAAAGAAALAAPRFALANSASHGFDEGRYININGVEQWITIRGRDARNPVVVFLHGGPGLGMASAAPLFADWESRYTVVQWDQPRSGFTQARNVDRDIGPLTLERFTADALAVVNHVRKTTGAKRVVLFGHSWGSQIGLTLARRHPEVASAYVGTGQAVSGSQGGKLGYELALDAARKRNDTTAVAALEKVGPPPYSTVEEFFVRQQYANPPGLPQSPIEKERNAAMARFMSTALPANATYIPAEVPQYDMIANFIDTQKLLFQESEKFEAAATLGYRYRVPIYFFEGENDINVPMSLAREYLERVEAPRKAFRVIPGAGHNTMGAFHAELLALFDSEVRPHVT
ncbi:MAG: alpha/beta hydrolase [Gammaproteobacteria bacterium]